MTLYYTGNDTKLYFQLINNEITIRQPESN